MPSETLFPYLTSTGPAPPYSEVVRTYRNVLATRYAEGTLRPLVIPYHLYGGFLLMAYLCIPHTKSTIVYAAQWPVLVVIIWFEWTTVRETSSQSPATALAAGLTCAWGVVWSVTWLVLRRPQWDARRVQRRRRREGDSWIPFTGGGGIRQAQKDGELAKASKNSQTEKEDMDTEEQTLKINEGNGHLRNRALVNGQSNVEETNGVAKSSRKVLDESVHREEQDTGYYWQSYPDNIWERIPWVMDLIMNFRGPGWNWAIPPLPDLPQHIKLELGDTDSTPPSKGVSPVGLQQYTTRRQLFYARVPEFLVGYFILDFLKVAMMKDPYYLLGPNTYALPPYLASLSPLQLRVYREILSAVSIVVSIRMALALMPLWMCLLNGPRIFGLRAEPWYFPSYWGSFSNILDKGLNGLWGGWWHQTFRLAFSAPSNYLIENGYIAARSMTARVAALVCAFGISGFLHMWGSITQVPETHTWAPPVFFMWQAVGIFVQTTFTSYFRSPLKKVPKAVGQAANLSFTVAWLVATGWILVDDFSRGGIWLYEPIPISPLRGLGFGVEGDGWWCWEHIGVSWYTGKHWWESGIAL